MNPFGKLQYKVAVEARTGTEGNFIFIAMRGGLPWVDNGSSSLECVSKNPRRRLSTFLV